MVKRQEKRTFSDPKFGSEKVAPGHAAGRRPLPAGRWPPAAGRWLDGWPAGRLAGWLAADWLAAGCQISEKSLKNL